MQRLKNTLFHSKQKDDRNRDQCIIKDEDPVSLTGSPNVPLICQENLTDAENEVYTMWWKQLDPDSLGRLDLKTLLKFLAGCNLAYPKLGQILSLFADSGDSISESHFYALLRLVSHSQQGRNIHKDLCYMGAPVAQLSTDSEPASLGQQTQSPSPALTNREYLLGDQEHWNNMYPKSSSSPNFRETYQGSDGRPASDGSLYSQAQQQVIYSPNTTFDYHASPLYDAMNPSQDDFPATIPMSDLVDTPIITWTSVPNNDSQQHLSYPSSAAIVAMSERNHQRNQSLGLKPMMNDMMVCEPGSSDPKPYYSVQEPSEHETVDQVSLDTLGNSLLLTQPYEPPTNDGCDEDSPFKDQLDNMTFAFGNNLFNHQPNVFNVNPPPVPCQSTKPKLLLHTKSL